MDAATRLAPDELSRVLELAPVGVLQMKHGGIVAYVNRAMCSMLGEPREAVLGRSGFDYLAPEDQAMVRQRNAHRLVGERAPARYEVTLVRRDGSRLQVELQPRIERNGDTIMLVREVGVRPRHEALLGVLSDIANRVRRARTRAEVFEAAGAGLRSLGRLFVAARLDGEDLVVEYADLGPANDAVQRVAGRPAKGLRMPLRKTAFVAQVLAERRTLVHDRLEEMVAHYAARAGLDLSKAGTTGVFGNARCIASPLLVDGDIWGVMIVAASDVSTADAAAVNLFASQMGAALEISETIEDLERTNRELAAIHQVAGTASETELDELLPHLLRIAAEATGSEGSAIYLLDGERPCMKLAGVHGGQGLLAQKYREIDLNEAREDLQVVLLETQAFRVAEQLPPGAREAMQSEGFQHLAIIPLHAKGRLAGTLSLGRKSARPYTADELRSAERLCSQIALQVESAQLYADLRRRVGMLSVLFDLSRMGAEALEVAPLTERVLAKITEAITVDVATLHLYEDGRLGLAAQRGLTTREDMEEIDLDDQTLIGRAAVRHATQVVDLQSWPARGGRMALEFGMRRAASVPLLSQGRLTGVITAVRREDRPFDVEELRLLESCAAQVAAAIDHARLFEDERRRVEELKLFLEVARVITASLDLEQILELAAASLAEIADATHSFIYLLDRDRRVLEGCAASEARHRDAFKQLRIPLEASTPAVIAMRTAEPLRVADVERSTLVPPEVRERFQEKSLLALPLRVRDEPVGAAVICDSRRGRAWTEAEVERATVVARQVAVAIANARLYDDLKRSYQRLAETQEQLVSRERLAALGELAAVVAHEVRNPLGAIFNSLGTLRRVLHPSGDTAMLLDIVEEEADRLNRIVGDLLDFARPNEPSLQPEPLGHLIAAAMEAAAPLASKGNVRLRAEGTETLPAISADARMLRQALFNLVVNAIQAVPEGGTVTVRACEELQDGLRRARIDVSDDGPGVPEELAERIFKPFFTTKASGTGLGLAVVKRILEAHQGQVSMRSTPGEGATFTLRVPIEPSR